MISVRALFAFESEIFSGGYMAYRMSHSGELFCNKITEPYLYSYDSINFLSWFPRDFLQGNEESMLKASSNQAHFNEKSEDSRLLEHSNKNPFINGLLIIKPVKRETTEIILWFSISMISFNFDCKWLPMGPEF